MNDPPFYFIVEPLFSHTLLSGVVLATCTSTPLSTTICPGKWTLYFPVSL